jgi:dTDP-4-amino-4,6-dideoxygalactose transaminase
MNGNHYMIVPFTNLRQSHHVLKNDLLRACEQVLDHSQFILGPEVNAFERAFADYCGVRYAVGVDNGTNALVLSLLTMQIGPGSEVITPANSFLASASSIALAGARPVLVDVRDDSSIDPEMVDRAITSRTRAIIPVHLTGRPADMEALCDIANSNGIHIVEDAAQAIGAQIGAQKVGSIGKIGCFSLHPLKVLNALGDGGVITTNDSAIYNRLLMARNHGLRNRDDCAFWSLNARLDTIQAAMLLVKMKYLDGWIAKRRKVAQHYCDNLGDIVTVPKERSGDLSVYQTYVIQCRDRDQLKSYMYEKGVETKIHYPIPIHLLEGAACLGYGVGDFPMCEAQSRRILSLPIYPELSDDQISHVVSAIREFYTKF